jgi:hypothetical protein
MAQRPGAPPKPAKAIPHLVTCQRRLRMRRPLTAPAGDRPAASGLTALRPSSITSSSAGTARQKTSAV